MSLRVRILSDLHNEISLFTPPVADADVVILAGDIDTGVEGIAWAAETFDCPVLYVPGNHEFYGGHLARTLQKMQAASTGQVHVLDCAEVVIGGVRFLGATGWTDYTSTDNVPLAVYAAQQTMRDFRKIRTGDYRRVRPNDFSVLSQAARKWLRARLAEPFDGKTVVVTHHAPSLASLAGAKDAGTHLDAAYANCWEDLMLPGVALWVHGHTHHAVDFELRGTRVVSNPRGYPGEATGFQADLVVAV